MWEFLINKEKEIIKTEQTVIIELERTITKIIHWGAHSRFELAEESGLEDRSIERLCSLRNRKKKNKEKQMKMQRLWDTIKCTNTEITGVPEEEKKYKEAERTLRK